MNSSATRPTCVTGLVTSLPLGLILLLLAAFAGGCRPVPSVPVGPVDPATGWVLTVRESGPRWIGPELWRDFGVEAETLDPAHVRLQQNGAAVPFLWIDGPGGPGLLFHGTVTQTRAGTLGGYALTIGEGSRAAMAPLPEAGAAGSAQETSWETLRLEHDRAYRTTAPLDLPWLWESFHPPETITEVIALDRLPGGSAPVTLTLHFWGQSALPQNPDHHVRVIWNGEVVDDHLWDGAAPESWSVPAEAREGENVLALSVPGDTEAPVEVTWLDAVEVTWLRALRAQPERAWETWAAGDAEAACWEDLPEGPLQAIAVDAGGTPYDAGTHQSDGGELCLPQHPGGRGWVGLPWEAPPPDAVRPREVADVAALAAADYLVVAPAAFHEALAPLVAAREAGGLAVALVTPEALYDTFGDGLPRAENLRRAVAYLAAQGGLRYLLLVGDAPADPAAWVGGGPWVPTAWVRTAIVGDTPSDFPLVADESGEPQVAVGRLPVTGAEELRAVVEKTLAWETQPASRTLYLVDDEMEFTGMADVLSAFRAPADRLYAGDADVREATLAWLGEGPGTLVYSGHGSLPLLGDEKLLTAEDAGAWEGPTVVVAWTCLSAHFTHPSREALAEIWLRDPQGAVAFVGSSGETTTAEQRALALAFHEALASGETLGGALLAGWRATQVPDARASFLLLGDPALRPFAVEEAPAGE